MTKKSTRIKGFPVKKKSEFHGKHYSIEAKDIICKVADWIKLAIPKQKRSQRIVYSFYSVVILYENVAEQPCGICKVSKYTFYRTLKGKKEIKKTKMESRKLSKIKLYLRILIKQPFQ